MTREDRSAVLWYEGARATQLGARGRSNASAELLRDDRSTSGHSQQLALDRVVRIWLFGRLSARNVPRPLVLTLPHGISAREAILQAREQLGSDVVDNAVTPGGCCRVCINGRIVDELDRPLEIGPNDTDIEMILLIPYDGG